MSYLKNERKQKKLKNVCFAKNEFVLCCAE